MTRTQALQKLYRQITGESKAQNTPSEILSDLADKWNGSGSSAGGGSTLQVKIDPSDPHGLIYDKTWQQVHDALERGDYVTYEFRPHVGMNLSIFLRIMYAAFGNGQYGVLVERVNVPESEGEWSTYIESGDASTTPFFALLTDPNAVLIHGQIG